MKTIKQSSKALALLLALCGIMGISACKKEEENSTDSSSEIASSIDVVKTGELTGCIMYSNNSSGNPAFEDAGAVVELVSLETIELPANYTPLSSAGYEGDGIFQTTTDSSGYYEFRDIPIGEYRFIVRSANARWSKKTYGNLLGDIYSEINTIYGENLGSLIKDSYEKKSLLFTFAERYTHNEIITIKENKSTNKNITCINWWVIK
ncbi:MAG: carboxypeptidase regulatory-like domain-containing protein [Clostridia bacterium]|nr:carboxypeptidase regulatory-like domain-containing protein [Clostridia bacterium]